MEYSLIDSELLILKNSTTIAEDGLLTCRMHGKVRNRFLKNHWTDFHLLLNETWFDSFSILTQVLRSNITISTSHVLFVAMKYFWQIQRLYVIKILIWHKTNYIMRSMYLWFMIILNWVFIIWQKLHSRMLKDMALHSLQKFNFFSEI